jgi:hypothetical protein
MRKSRNNWLLGVHVFSIGLGALFILGASAPPGSGVRGTGFFFVECKKGCSSGTKAYFSNVAPQSKYRDLSAAEDVCMKQIGTHFCSADEEAPCNFQCSSGWNCDFTTADTAEQAETKIQNHRRISASHGGVSSCSI